MAIRPSNVFGIDIANLHHAANSSMSKSRNDVFTNLIKCITKGYATYDARTQ